MAGLVIGAKIALCVISVIIVIIVLMQKPKEGVGGGAMGQSGGASYLDKMKGQTQEGRLMTLTKVFTGLFFVILFVLMFI